MKAVNVLAAVAASSFSLSLVAQNQLPAAPAACGDVQVRADVQLDAARHEVALPEPGKALIYFIQDIGTPAEAVFPTTNVGIDGTWVGANHKDSYFSVPVDAGEHHICVSWEWLFSPFSPRQRVIELAHLNAEAGGVYFYRVLVIRSQGGPVFLILNPVDSDAGKYLVETHPLATAHLKK